jgi:hypothetical protein
VYEKKPRTTVNLKQNIRDEVATISPTMLQRVMQNFQKRFWECVNRGRYIQEVNIVIKMLSDKDNFSNKFMYKDSILFILS